MASQVTWKMRMMLRNRLLVQCLLWEAQTVVVRMKWMRDESVDLTRAETQGPTSTTQTSTTKQSAKGKGKWREYRWGKGQCETPAAEDDEQDEKASDDQRNRTLYMECSQQPCAYEMLQEGGKVCKIKLDNCQSNWASSGRWSYAHVVRTDD